jgi:aminoglycoside 2'-N-acetyltransferase I
MSIEIEIVNGGQSGPPIERLFAQSWTEEEADAAWRHIKWADPDLRVLIDAPDGELACHAGIFFRTATWNGQKVHVGGIGQVATRPECRRRGYASIALEAAVHTMRDHDAAQFALLFCEPHNFEVYAEQPEGRIRFEVMAPMVLDLKRRAPTLGTLDLCGLPW